jgi:SAM-dependent methyltransferase
MSTAVKVKTWDDLAGEEYMQEGHGPSWRAMINQMDEVDLSSAKVLDFGCNRGGFLRMLYDAKPYKQALGIDIATDSVAVANQLKSVRPIDYAHNDELSAQKGSFDYAFSHEVVYLLPDMDAHAREIYDALKPGGVYYLVIGEYAENPLWPKWYSVVQEFSPVPPQNYSLNDIATSFDKAGFSVAINRLDCQGFFNYTAGGDRYIKNPLELVKFMTEYMMMFKLVKK